MVYRFWRAEARGGLFGARSAILAGAGSRQNFEKGSQRSAKLFSANPGFLWWNPGSCGWETRGWVEVQPNARHQNGPPRRASCGAPYVFPMSGLLIAWLNDEVKLSRRVQSLDQDFANGYLFAELLTKLGFETDGVVRSNEPKAMVSNFSRISTVLSRMRVKLTPTEAKDIMTQSPGAAMRIVYQVKMEMNRRAKIAESQSTPRRAARARVTKAVATGDTDRLYGRKSNFEKIQAKFFRSQLTHTMSEQTKNERMEQHLKKFSEFKKRSDDHARRISEAMYKLEKQEAAEYRKHRLTQMKRKQEFQKQWERQGMENWKQNRTLARARRAQEVSFELTMKERRRRRKDNIRQRDTMEVRSCIDEFERNLDRIGVQEEEDGPPAVDAKGEPIPEVEEDPDEMDTLFAVREKLKTKVPDPRAMALDAMNSMQRIRERKQADQIARRERSRRRKKVLVDEQNAFDQGQLAERQQVLLDTLLVDCRMKREAAHESWRMEQMREIIKENARFRARQLAEARERDRAATVERARAAYRASIEEQTQRSGGLLARWNELAQEQAARERKVNTVYCRKIALRIAGLAQKVSAHRELVAADKTSSAADMLVPRADWRQWVDLIVAFKDVAPTDSKAGDSDAKVIFAQQQRLQESGAATEEGALSLEELATAAQVNDRINATARALELANDDAVSAVVGADVKRYFSGEGKWAPARDALAEFAAALAGEGGDGDAADAKAATKGKQKGGGADEAGPVAADAAALGAAVADMAPGYQDPALGALIQRLSDAVQEAELRAQKRPSAPKQPLTVCLLGKPYAGKKTTAESLATRFGLETIALKVLIEEAVAAASASEDEGEPKKAAKGDARAKLEDELKALGSRAKEALAEGKGVDDELSVDLIVAKIQRINAAREAAAAGEGGAVDGEGGWCLIGFPQTRAQAELLELKLSGFKLADQNGGKKSKAAPTVGDEPEVGPYPSGIDAVIELQANRSTLLARATGQLVDPQTGDVYHALSRPPPDNVAVRQRLRPPQDHDQLVSKLVGQADKYEAAVGAVREWFGLFANFSAVRVDSRRQPLGQSSDFVSDGASRVVDEVLAARAAKEAADKKAGADAEAQSAADKKAAEEKTSAAFENDRAAAEAAAAGDEAKDVGAKEEGKQGAADGEAAEAAAAAPDTPAAEQISEYTIESAAARRLLEGWSSVERAYLGNLSSVVRSLQAQRISAVKHYAKTRENFRLFLARPSVEKNERVEEFQDDFNSIHMDLRADPAAKAELHQRVEELQDELWEMTRRRKNAAVDELNAIQSQGWLERQAYIVAVLCSVLIQLELKRYRGALRVARAYFAQCLGPSAVSPDAEQEPVVLSFLEDEEGAPAPLEASDDGKDAEEGADSEVQEAKFAYDYKAQLKTCVDEALAAAAAPESAAFGLGPAEEVDEKAAKEEDEKGGAALAELKASVSDSRARASKLLRALVANQNRLLALRLQRSFQFAVSAVEETRAALFDREYPRMQKEIAARIKGESAAIDSLAAEIMTAIEGARPLFARLALEDCDFVVDDGYLVKSIPEAPQTSVFRPTAPPAASVVPVAQLRSLSKAFAKAAPGGVISAEQAATLLLGLAKTQYASGPGEGVPAAWRRWTLTDFARALAPYALAGPAPQRVDWREFVLRLSLPAASPAAQSTEELVALSAKLADAKTDAAARRAAVASLAAAKAVAGKDAKTADAIAQLWLGMFATSPSALAMFLCAESNAKAGVAKAAAVAKATAKTPEDALNAVLYRGVDPAVYSAAYRESASTYASAQSGLSLDNVAEKLTATPPPALSLYALKSVVSQ